MSTLHPDQSLNDALEAPVHEQGSGLPVLGPDPEQVIGWLTPRDVLMAYSSRLGASVDRAEQQPHEVVPQPRMGGDHILEPELARLQGYRVVDLELGQDAPPVGHRIADLQWPLSSVLVAIRRGPTPITVSERTRLHHGDHLTLITPASGADQVSDLVERIHPTGDGQSGANGRSDHGGR